MKKICIEGCINLVGAVIAQSLEDYRDKDFKENNKWEWDRIDRFLFRPGRLELFLKTFSLDGMIDLGFIRMVAKSRRRLDRFAPI
jgi:hypothetical protein